MRIKWPNDIYSGRTHKLGGVLVNCTVTPGQMQFVIGLGVNVTNEKPTVCVNDILADDADPLTVPQVVAATLNRLEQLIDVFQTHGRDAILPLYYKYWLHSYVATFAVNMCAMQGDMQ